MRLRDHTTGSARLCCLAACLVAIGLAAPASALHLAGHIRAGDPAWDGAPGTVAPEKAASENATSNNAQPENVAPRATDALAWLPVTFVLPPGQRPIAARARVTSTGEVLRAECLGSTGDHGYQVGLVRVARPRPELGPADIDVEIETGPGATLPVARRRYDPELERRTRASLQARVANPAALDDPAFVPQFPPAGGARAKARGYLPSSDPSLDGSGVRYLVITTEQLAPAFQPLVDWKTSRGVPATLRTLEWIESRTRHGIDRAETLRNFLIQAYALWGVEWVLIGGDTGVVPVRYAWSSTEGGSTTPTDMYYACLDGTWNDDGDAHWGEGSQTLGPSEADIYPELGVARAPANNLTEAQTFVSRVLDYEKPLYTDYQQRITFLTEVLVPANWDSGTTISYDGAPSVELMISESTPPTMQVQRLYDSYWMYPGSQKLRKDAALAAMNAGAGYVNHLGHGFRYTMSCGNESVVNPDADALVNGARRFVLLMMNCAAVAFDYNCLAERFVLNPAGGAAAAIGAARSVGANYVTLYNRAFYRELFENGHVHLSEILNEMRLERAAISELESGDRWLQFNLNALGDPEMTLFTGPVRTASLVHGATLPTAPGTFDVQVQAAALPVAGARVCASKGTEVYAVATTDASGDVHLPVEPATTGALYLTVSGQNLATRTDTVQVVASGGPVLALGTATLDDDALGASDGDGDGNLDAGETVELAVQVHNYGAVAANGVLGTLTSPDTTFAVLQGGLDIGTVAGGASAPGAAPLVVRVAPGVADGKAIDLPLDLHDELGAHWSAHIHLLVCAPRPEVTRVLATPGAAHLTSFEVDVKNYGSGKQSPLLVKLAPPHAGVVAVEDSSQLPTLASLAQGVGAPLLEVAPADTTAPLPPFSLRFSDARNRNFDLRVDLAPPAAPGFAVADLTFGAGIVHLTWPVSAAADHLGYHVFRAPGSGGSFARITPDLVRPADYYDNGVLANSSYRYYIVDVDSSRQWSTPSPTITVNTTAASFPGFPLEMSDPTASSVAVGDVDGDGNPEIVVGDNGVYAWHANGIEVLDGDHSGNTNGVFSTATGTMNASVALAEIDGQPGLEIVAASWLTNRIYIWKGNGELLPGWPVQPANGGNPGYWASPAVADLDGDGQMEIIAISKDGWLYVWHADGTPLLPGNGGVRQVGIWTQTTPAIADLDGDGHREIIVSGSTAKVYVIRDNGTDFPGWPYTLFAAGKGSPAVGDVDHDGDLDIVLTSESDHLYVFNANGTVWPGWPKLVPGDAPDFGPSPALGDLNGDGKLEIVVCAVKNPFTLTKIYVFDSNGNTLLVKQLEINSQSSPILADLDGDGNVDIVHGGEIGTLHAWNLAGQELAGFPIPIGDSIRGTPQYCDLDRDGYGDLVLAGWNARVYAWKMIGPYAVNRAPWPTYHGNIQRTGFLSPSFATATEEPPAARRLVAAWSPNPFNPTVSLLLTVPVDGVAPSKVRAKAGAAAAAQVPVRVAIYDVRGRLLRVLLDAPLSPGTHRLGWDGRDADGRSLGTGVYVYAVQAGPQRVSGKLTLLR